MEYQNSQKLQNQKKVNKLTKAIVFFQQNLVFPTSPSFQQHLDSLLIALQNDTILRRVLAIMVQRFYQVSSQIAKSMNQEKAKSSQKLIAKRQSEIVKFGIQQFLLIKFITTVGKIAERLWMFEKESKKSSNINKQDKQLVVILLSSLISLLKSNLHRSVCVQILKFLRFLVEFALQNKLVSVRNIYPQIYSHLSGMITSMATSGVSNEQETSSQNSLKEKLGHKNFDQALKILSLLILANFSQKLSQRPKISLIDEQKQKSRQKSSMLSDYVNLRNNDSFQKQASQRLLFNLKTLIRMVPMLKSSPAYIISLENFTQQISKGMYSLQVQSNVILLNICLGKQGLIAKSKVRQEILTEVSTEYFVTLLNNCKADHSMLNHQKICILKLMISLAPYLNFASLNQESADQTSSSIEAKIIKKIMNTLFKVKNSSSAKISAISSILSVKSNNFSETINLLQLKPQNNFKNYPGGLSSLKDALQKQEISFLSGCLNFCDGQYQVCLLLREFLLSLCKSRLMKSTKLTKCSQGQLMLNFIFEELLLNQYMVDMSVQKFNEYLGNIIVMRFLVQGLTKVETRITGTIATEIGTETESISKSTQKIFNLLSCSQAIRILKPSFKEQELLISLTISILLLSFNNSKLHPLKKLKAKVLLYQNILNNVSQDSYLIKVSTFYAILNAASPGTVKQSLMNVQTSIISKGPNLGNISLMKNLIRLGDLSTQDCEQLSQIYYTREVQGSNTSRNSFENAEILKLLIPKLSIATIRKCILSCNFWPILLKDNLLILHNKNPNQKESQGFSLYQNTKDKSNFYSNDGQNVVISNMLGVLIIQLGYKWRGQLLSPRKQLTVNIILDMVSLNPELIFFRRFFKENLVQAIFTILQNLCQKFRNSNMNYQGSQERLLAKICKILQLIPSFCFKIYGKQICQKLNKLLELPRKMVQKKVIFSSGQAKQQQFYQKLYDSMDLIQEKMLVQQG